MDDEYPDKEFPWNFYFNGEIMPKWGACWGLARIADFVKPGREIDEGQDVGHRDIYTIYCQIDHVGIVESADADIFIYAVQEILQIFLSCHDTVLSTLAEQQHGQPQEVYSDLVEAAFQMRELAVAQHRAFWTSGYEADRARLVELMRRCQLPSDSANFTLPPHIVQLRQELQWHHKEQVRRLHQLAQSGQFDKWWRRKLHEIRLS